LPQRHPRAQPSRHGILATVIGTQYLLDEQHHRRERAVQAFPPAPRLFQYSRLQDVIRDHLAQCRSRRLNKPGAKPPNLFGETAFLGSLLQNPVVERNYLV
jgi:hypothetical protein